MGAHPVIEFTRDFAAFLRDRKRYWLLPIAVVLLAIGLLVYLTLGSTTAPLIYRSS